MIAQIHAGKIRNWGQVHQFYTRQGEQYAADKLVHALAALKQIGGISPNQTAGAPAKQTGATPGPRPKQPPGPSLRKMGKTGFAALLRQSIATREWMTKEIYASRAKDYTNPFRKMVYDSPEEMNAVVGRLQDNGFIRQEKEAAKKYRKEIEQILQQFGL